MLAKRIIPCLDLKDGKVVKGINFVDLQEVGDPVEYAKEYELQGADELVLLDITASHQGRETTWEIVEKISKNVFMPVTVGGGIASIQDFQNALHAGADKVAINSAAIKNPSIISEAAEKFGSQCVVCAIDAKKTPDGNYHVFIHGGRIDTEIDLVFWVKKVQKLGAGEILLTSMDADGTKNGFDLPMLKVVTQNVNIPVIASGGCGSLSDFTKLFEETNSSAALAASLFHFHELTISDVKKELRSNNIPIRCEIGTLEDFSFLFQKSDLIPAIIFEKKNKEVLMLAYMNLESLTMTLETGYTWFWSRSRNEYWNKGKTSGHLQKVLEIYTDCDSDTLLIYVEQTGVACHTGSYSCFHKKII